MVSLIVVITIAAVVAVVAVDAASTFVAATHGTVPHHHQRPIIIGHYYRFWLSFASTPLTW